VPGIRRTKKAIKLAFQAQLAGLGFSMVEVISTCNTNWHMGPVEALEWAKEHMVAYFPVGDTKVADGVQALKGGK
jgi:2-oxoglutarate ferredoxin oxidoreductase subunit beta